MRSHLECVPCFFAQAVRAARLAGLHEAAARQLLDELGQLLPTFDASLPPPQNAAFLYRRLAELSGLEDPFAEIKREHTELALSLEPTLRAAAAGRDDPVDAWVRLAAAGNILDVGALAEIGDVEARLEEALEAEHPCWQIDLLKQALGGARTLLVVGDNAGETVLDRLLIEALLAEWPGLEVRYAARGGPIINDATEEDARAAGLHHHATIVSTGSALPGVVLTEASDEFRRLFETVDVVVAKGQGNFETLCESRREVFFVLTVKCRVVARHLGLPLGASVLVHHRP